MSSQCVKYTRRVPHNISKNEPFDMIVWFASTWNFKFLPQIWIFEWSLRLIGDTVIVASIWKVEANTDKIGKISFLEVVKLQYSPDSSIWGLISLHTQNLYLNLEFLNSISSLKHLYESCSLIHEARKNILFLIPCTLLFWVIEYLCIILLL